MLLAWAGRRTLHGITRGSHFQCRAVVTPRRARYTGSYRYTRRLGARFFRFGAVFGISAAVVAVYPLIVKRHEASGPEKSERLPRAEIVFERTRKETASLEETRDLLSSQHLQVKQSWENPGLYAWGLNSGKVAAPGSRETYIKTPRRIPFFDGQLLRDLRLDRDVGVAITEKGDLVQWGIGTSKANPNPVVTLEGRDLVKVTLSQDRIITLSSGGAVYSLPISNPGSPKPEAGQKGPTPWASFWSTPSASQSVLSLTPKNLGWGEKVVDISSGQEHCLILTSKGRVFSAASSAESFPSVGQLGISGLSWDNRPSGPYCRPHEIIELHKCKAVGIATGDFHSLVLDSEGRIHAFGSNSAGQLGVATETKSPFLDHPVRLPVESLYTGTGFAPKVTSIAAGGSNSFFTVDAIPVLDKEGSVTVPRTRGTATADTWACGEGIYGTLGTGKWTHGHPSAVPAKLKALSNLSEFDDATNRAVPIRLAHVSVGSGHVSAVMKNITNVSASKTSGNDTNWGADVLFWGRNEAYQLGTGRRNNENIPIYIGPLDSSKVDADRGGNGEGHRFQLTPRKTIRLGENGGRRASVEQRVVCGRDVTAVYSAS